MPRTLEIAMQTAILKRMVSVIALPGDIPIRDVIEGAREYTLRTRSLKSVPLMRNSKNWRRCLIAQKE